MDKKKGYVIFTKNGREYKVRDKRFFKWDKFNFYYLDKKKTMLSVFLDCEITSICFENCDFYIPEKVDLIYFKVGLFCRDVRVKDVNFKKAVTVKFITEDSDVYINNLGGVKEVCIQGYNVCINACREQRYVISGWNVSIYDVSNLEFTIDAKEISLRNCISSPQDGSFSLKAEEKVELKNVGGKYLRTVIDSPVLIYEGVLIYSNLLTFPLLFGENDIHIDEYIDDEKLAKIESYYKFVSILKGVQKQCNLKITDVAMTVGSVVEQENMKKIDALEAEIASLKNAKARAIESTTTEYEKKSVGEYVKKK